MNHAAAAKRTNLDSILKTGCTSTHCDAANEAIKPTVKPLPSHSQTESYLSSAGRVIMCDPG